MVEIYLEISGYDTIIVWYVGVLILQRNLLLPSSEYSDVLHLQGVAPEHWNLPAKQHHNPIAQKTTFCIWNVPI